MTVRVLVVEDEAVAAEAHAAYVGRVAGFEVAGIARSGVDALRVLASRPVDLVLLDMHLPDVHGLDLLQRMRQDGHLCDVIAVTSARDIDVVKRAVAQGVVQYVLKPFTFAGLRTKLEQYAAYRSQLSASSSEVVQGEVDQLFGMLRPAATELPKGLSADTLQAVTSLLRTATDALSATEVASDVGTSRVTARRYLEHLADSGLAERQSRYGSAGRPEVEYRWRR
ncbi:MAG TPA: response regulator [Nocardioidaceae bacterium]|nr:response regulator [Nocardioidaceae bacterium]